jgi:hypothetical protein
MSVDNQSGNAESQSEFEHDAEKVKQIAASALMQAQENGGFDTAPGERVTEFLNFCQTEEIPPEEAIVGAWLFILSFE